MLKKVIAGWNANRDDPCGALRIRLVPAAILTTPGVQLQYCESAWEPTPAELDALNAGGQVILRVCGWQCPVALYCELPPEEPT